MQRSCVAMRRDWKLGNQELAVGTKPTEEEAVEASRETRERYSRCDVALFEAICSLPLWHVGRG